MLQNLNLLDDLVWSLPPVSHVKDEISQSARQTSSLIRVFIFFGHLERKLFVGERIEGKDSKTLGIALFGIIFLFSSNQVSKPDKSDLPEFCLATLLAARASCISLLCSFIEMLVIFPEGKVRKEVSGIHDGIPSGAQSE